MQHPEKHKIQLEVALTYSKQICYQDAPLHNLSVYQVSRQSNNLFPLHGNFHTLTKRRKNKETKQFLKVHISEMPGEVYLKFGMWRTDSRGHLHSKNCPGFYKQHEVTYVHENCIIVLPVNYSQVWCVGFLGHKILCVLISFTDILSSAIHATLVIFGSAPQ